MKIAQQRPVNIPIIPCDAWEYNGNKVDGSDYSEIQQSLKRRKYFCIELLKHQCPSQENTDNERHRRIKNILQHLNE